MDLNRTYCSPLNVSECSSGNKRISTQKHDIVVMEMVWQCQCYRRCWLMHWQTSLTGHRDLFLRHLVDTMLCFHFFRITTYTILFQSSRGLDPETNGVPPMAQNLFLPVDCGITIT